MFSTARALPRAYAAVTRNYSQKAETHAPKAASAEPEVVFEVKGKSAVARLNRPKALNSLNLNMVRAMTPQYQEWESSSSPVSHVVLMGTGEKAFCAGGDIRAIYDAAKADKHHHHSHEVAKTEPIQSAFFREEYILNHMIGTLKKPHVALIDGITMGGGVGLSIHGTVRVATEHTTFAMPETGIGFFPDVGGSYALSRMQNFGMFFGLTGYRIQGADVKEAGVATHYVLREFLPELTAELTKAADLHAIRTTLAHFEELTQKKSAHQVPSTLHKNAELIQRCFHQPTVSHILAALAKEHGNTFAHEILETLTKRVSPLAVRVTFEQLKRGSKLSLAECLEMEYRMTQHAMHDHDFFEGVRALLVDKDKNPKWRHKTIADVPDADVAKYFTPVQNELKLPRQR